EDGIRDRNVTGVQTCALPICTPPTGEDARPAYDPVGIDAVDTDALATEFGGEQTHLVGLVRLDRGVGDVVGSCKNRVLGGDVDEIGRASCREGGEKWAGGDGP